MHEPSDAPSEKYHGDNLSGARPAIQPGAPKRRCSSVGNYYLWGYTLTGPIHRACAHDTIYSGQVGLRPEYATLLKLCVLF